MFINFQNFIDIRIDVFEINRCYYFHFFKFNRQRIEFLEHIDA